MDEIITIGKALLSGGSQAATVGLLTVLAVPKLRKKIFGSEDSGRLDAIEGAINALGGNHIEHVQKAVDELKRSYDDGQNKEIEILSRIDTRLADIIQKINN